MFFFSIQTLYFDLGESLMRLRLGYMQACRLSRWLPPYWKCVDEVESEEKSQIYQKL